MPDVDCTFDEDRSHSDNLDQMLRDAEENYSEREFGKCNSPNLRLCFKCKKMCRN